MPARVILLDIEGATTPIDFVYGTLFPFASSRVEKFLSDHAGDDEVRELLAALPQQGMEGPQSWASYVRSLFEGDSKLTALKTLQGKIWEEGYRNGELRGEVYPDVAPALARWRAQGRRIAVFSSGSVLAQKLLFRHSTEGDLTPYFEAFFDTTTGPKREAESYRRIARALDIEPEGMLFVSDVTAELDAARLAGCQTAHSLRPGIAAPESGSHPAIHTFAEIFPVG